MAAVGTAMLAAGVVAPARASAAGASAAAATSCAVTWGSLAKAHSASTEPFLSQTRTGRHACFDRVVFEFEGAIDGYQVEYVDQVRTQPDGWVLPVTGGARLRVTLVAGVVDETGHRMYFGGNPPEPLADMTGYKTLRDFRFGGSNSIGHPDEFHTTFGIGVRARLPFRAYVLPGPGDHSRLVIDIAHRW